MAVSKYEKDIVQALFGKDSTMSLSSVVLYGNGYDQSRLKNKLARCPAMSIVRRFLKINAERFPVWDYSGLERIPHFYKSCHDIETIIFTTAALLSNALDTTQDPSRITEIMKHTEIPDMDYLEISPDLIIGSQPATLISSRSTLAPSDFNNINDSHLHNLVCTNDQPQLMDVFPLVYRKLPSLNIIVLSLTEDLDHKPDTFSCEREPRFTNRELIIKVCQSVSRQNSNAKGVSPRVMIAAISSDEVSDPEARVREFNHNLAENVAKEFSNVLLCKSEKEIIFSISDIICCSHNLIHKELFASLYTHPEAVCTQVKIPLKRLIYFLIILKVNGVLTMSDCVKIGKLLDDEMELTEVQDALVFLEDMGLAVTDFSNDFILTNLHLLMKHLSLLVMPVQKYSVHLSQNTSTQRREHDKLIRKGSFNVTYLSSIPANFRSSLFDENKMSDEEFLKIWEFLKIIVSVGEREYFFPSALSYKPAVSEQLSDPFPPRASSMVPVDPPLTFNWGEYFLPDGFFFTVIIELLRRGGNGDGGYTLKPCTDVQQWREEIQLSLKDVGGKEAVIKLINRLKSIWIEVSSTIAADQICPVVYKKVYTAIEETRLTDTIKHFNIDSPEVATPCSLCQGCTVDHVACFSPDRAKITCTLNSDKIGDATKEMNYWFKDDNRTEVSDIKKSKPKLKEVFKLLRCKSTAWQDIGRELDLDYCDREQILKNIQKPKDEDKLEDVLYKWIESECSEVSWDNLYKVLKELKLNDVAQKLQQKFLTAAS